MFLPYVNDYVNTFSGKSITTQQWKDHLYAFYEKNGGQEKVKLLDSIDWNASIYFCCMLEFLLLFGRHGCMEREPRYRSRCNMIQA